MQWSAWVERSRMGQLRIMGYDGGDERSNASVDVEIESNGLTVHGAILEQGVVEVSYGKKGKVVWTNVGGSHLPVEQTWVGRENWGCEFRRFTSSKFGEIVCDTLRDTPALEPMNCENAPRANEHWEREMAEMEDEFEIDDFSSGDVGCWGGWR